MRKNKIVVMLACSALLGGMVSSAEEQIWDPDGDNINNGGAGTWDTLTDNWISVAPWVSGNDAVFGDSGGNYTVNLGTGVTVGDLKYLGTSKLQFKSVVDNTALTLVGDAVWNTGGGEIEFVNNTVNDTKLDLAGYTLTVSGGGEFDAGEKGNGANWGSGNLVFTESTIVRGAAFNIGQLSSVTLAGGSSFIQERNNNQDLNNDWVLNGDVTFGNRWNGRTTWANGEFSGIGRLTVRGMNTAADSGNGYFRLNNTDNSWSGGLTVDGSINDTLVYIVGGDSVLGATPGTFDADNIILKDGGIIKMNGIDMNANRGITLDGGGVIVNAAGNTINGAITGAGGLTIGRFYDSAGNATILASAANDYQGETHIVRGDLRLGIDNALPVSTIVNIGGDGTSALDMNGYDATIGGIYHSANNTRQIENNGDSISTLTLDVADGESYSYGANVTGLNQINLVKMGLGTQTISRNGGYSTLLGTIDVNGGELVWNTTGAGNSGAVSIGSGGTLSGFGLLNGEVTVAGALNPGNGLGTLTFNDSLTLESTATLTLEFSSTTEGEYDVLTNDGGDTFTAGGVLDLINLNYTATMGDSFLVFDNWSSFSGSFSSIDGTDLGGGLSFDTSNLLNDGTITVIPEPSTLGMLAIVGGGLLWIRRVFFG